MYRNTIHIPHLILASLAASFMFAGCSKEPSVTDNGKALNFSISVPDITVSKASPVTSISKFYTKGFTGEQQWFPLEGDAAELVELTDGSKAYPTYRWKQGDTKAFFAYSDNLPAGTSAAITKDGVTLTCNTVPADAADQADVLLGRYIGDGKDEGQAEIKFYHPLAQVVFKAGLIDGADAFTKIEIEDVFAAGSTTLSSSTLESGSPAVAAFDWNASGKMKVSQTISDASIPAAGSKIGESFMLIPQNLAEQNIKITVTATKGTETKYLTTTLDSGSLVAGRTSSYAINYDGMNVSLSVTVEPWDSDGGQKEAVAIEEKKNYPEGALPGVFTINASGDKVYFSKGNLQFRASANGTGTDLSHETADGTKQGIWRFAEHQWDIIGTSACPSYSQTYTGWIDLFTFGASGYDEKEPWGFNGVNVKSVYIQKTNCDWGWYNSISNGGDVPHLWHNISMGELAYIIDTRPKATVNGAQTNVGGLKINGRPGIVIYPDGFVYPEALNVYPADISSYFGGCGFPEINSSDFTVFTEAQFTELENLGVLFLPAAGCWCNGTNYTDDSNGVYNVDYLSGTKALTPLCFQFGIDCLWYPGFPLTASVRLVCDAPSE